MNKKVSFKITHQFQDVNISEADVKKILAFLGWEETPPFQQSGRTAWHILEKDATTPKNDKLSLSAAKIKGVGFWNPPKEGKTYSGVLANLHSAVPTKPTTKALDSMLTFPHIGFTKDGEYVIAFSKAAPLGGILHERALLEYESAEILLENGVPSTVPFLVIQYGEEFEFQGKPMGVVVNLSPERDTVRLSCIQYGKAVHRGKCAASDAYYDKLRASLGVKGAPESEKTRLQTINLLSRKIGKLVHDFSKAGLYRYSSEWSNFEYDMHTKSVFLTDLDSTLKLKDVTPEMQPLQVLRDLGTAIYRLVAKFGFPDVLDKYTLNNLLCFDPLAELLVGYFPDVPYDEIEGVSNKLWNMFIPHWYLLKKHKDSIWSDWTRTRRQSYKMDHDMFYVLAITLVFDWYKSSDLGKKYPTNLTKADMLQKAERYLGDRYEYFTYMLNHGAPIIYKPLEKGYRLENDEAKGEGVIATQTYTSGQTIMAGKIIKILGGNHSHGAQIGKNTWAIHAGLTHKINHSCSPNAGIYVNKEGGHDIVAIKAIQANEEILLDYALRNYKIEHFPAQCRCGSVECRGQITGWKDLPRHKKEEYRPWAATYLLEMEAENQTPQRAVSE